MKRYFLSAGMMREHDNGNVVEFAEHKKAVDELCDLLFDLHLNVSPELQLRIRTAYFKHKGTTDPNDLPWEEP